MMATRCYRTNVLLALTPGQGAAMSGRQRSFPKVFQCSIIPLFLATLLSLASLARGDQYVLTLSDAIDLALENNPDVAESASRLAEAEARLAVARSGRMPVLKARGVYDYWTEDQRLLPATRNADPGVFGSQMFGGELMVNLPLYTGGRISGEIAAAEFGRGAATDQLDRVQDSLIYQVKAVFYELLAQDEVVKSLETAVKAMDEQCRVTASLVEADKAARVDLLRANVRRAELYERQVRERNKRTVQQRVWAALLGLNDDSAPVAAGKLDAFEPVLCSKTAECMEKAFAVRPDYRAAGAAVASVEAAVGAARAGYLPKLNAQASYGRRWMPDPSDQPDGKDSEVDVGRVGLVLEIPLFDGRLTGARVAEQKARMRGAKERLRKMELQIRFEIESARADVLSAYERARVAEHAVAQAEESFRIISEKYDLGKGVMTDVLDAQTAQVAAETSLSRALADLSVSDARLQLAIGDVMK